MSEAVRQPPNHARASRMGRRRAWVLIGIHIAIALHIWHWKTAGRTVTPVEPSEAMQTLELGYVNAGFLFFVAAILGTLVFGRWFCGWACHIVALQDLCGWMLRKVGIRPKPIRSRLLVWVPVFAAFYMFAYPQIARLWEGRPAPAWAMHLTTEDFWATFPNLTVALLTFGVCGFLIVYVVGNKGFCTYGCPYGGIFYHADRLAPGKIRVTSDCNQCGHCTAVCTSNVRVHDEIRERGAVVDPGCMKCMDCVSVCPNDALYFGMGRPAVGLKPLPVPVMAAGHGKPPRRIPYDFTWAEEIGLAVLFAFGLYAYRGLYEAVPFLLALGLASISAFALLHAGRLFYRPQARFQRLQLKSGGKWTPAGMAFAAAAAGLAAYMGHSAAVNFHAHEGARWMAAAQSLQADSARASDADVAARRAQGHYRTAAGLAGVPVAEWEARLGSIAEALGDGTEAEQRYRRALELDGSRVNNRLRLAALLGQRGSFSEAAREYDAVLGAGRDLGAEWTAYAAALVGAGEFGRAEEPLRKAMEADPRSPANPLNLGMIHAQRGEWPEAERLLRRSLDLDPAQPRAWLNLGLVQASAGRLAPAAASLRKALALDASLAGAHSALGRIELEEGNRPAAIREARESLRLAPLSPPVVADYLAIVRSAGALPSESDRLLRAAESIPSYRYALSGLLRAAGRIDEADRELAEARTLRPDLPAQ